MRPPAVEKLGYYPTDEPVIDILNTYIAPASEKARLFDPCAGEGIAASKLGRVLNCATWGVELSPARAAKAGQVLDRVFQAPWQACFLSNESISLLFLNPPYESDEDHKRVELDFLNSTTSKLVRGGLLIFIVPQHILGLVQVARILAGQYECLTVERFPDGLFEKFKQVVVLGYRRKSYITPTEAEIEAVQAWAKTELEPLTPLSDPVYHLIPAPERGLDGRPVIFKRTDWEAEDVVQATTESGFQRTKEWLDLIQPDHNQAELTQPVMPLKKGHVAMLMASGMMGTVRLTDEEGRPMLIKGRVVKKVEKVGEEGKGEEVTETYRDRFVTTVAVLKQDKIEVIQDIQGLVPFMKAYGEKIAAHVMNTYRPLYNFDPTPQEIQVLDRLGQDRKPLPGQDRPGLLPTQRHAAAALARCIRKHGVANCQAEMGAGKASRNSARVYTPDGYKLMGEIQIGDLIIGHDGNPTRVLGVYPQGVQDIYRVTFNDGSFTEVTADHLWEVNSPVRNWRGYPWKICSTLEIVNSPFTHRNGNRQYFIPIVQPVQFNPRKVAIEPYVLGVLLGDGGLTNGTPMLTNTDNELLEEVSELLPTGVRLIHKDRISYSVSTGRRGANGQNLVTNALRELGLYGLSSCEKFIPTCYLYNTVQTREALLQGILDTDGSVFRGRIEYTTTSQRLAGDVKELVQSLGGIARMTTKLPSFTYNGEKKTGKTTYRVWINLPAEFQPFRLSRKKEVYRPNTKYLPARAITRIEYIGRDEATCIYIEDPRHLYATDEFILTHNTTISAATVDLLDAYPALIICPPHLVPKWIREVEEVIPGVHAREIRRIGRNAEDPGDINDVRAFLEDYDAGRLGKKAVAVVANTAAKFGAGWKPAAVRKRTIDPLTGQHIRAYACPTCGTVIETEENGVIVPVTDLEQLAKKRHFCRAMVPGWQLNPDGRRKLDTDGNPLWGTRLCGTPLFDFTTVRRESIAEYIAKKATGRFKMLVSDELHQFKGKSSDRGIAFHQLVTACKNTLTLTGTFFGGKSTSIFWLLHRLNAGVRRDFAFNEELRWARLYGVLETKRKRRRDDADEDGVFTGNRRYRNNAKEQPGISPAVINRLLDTTIFLSLKDLGLALPAYNEEVTTLEMLDEQSSQYQQMESTLKSMALQSNRYLSTWLQWSLARPNSAFREETVMIDEAKDEKGKVIRKVPLMVLPPVVNGNPKWLPKEGWLTDFCRNEKRQGRKVLVYVRQTGTRDIQDRVIEPLKEAGLRTAILSSGVDPRRREEWIANRVAHIDVLVCNPKLVETGLDLVQFATVAFFETEYSLYCLWQAVRRVWRLGQTKPVKALFSVYEGTMEARALALMGRKMRAAQTLYGDEVGGAIVPEEDGDLLTELAREVLSEADLPDLQAMFADDMQISHNPMGNLTVPSAVMVPEPKIMTWSDWVAGKSVLGQRKKKEVVPEGQMGLGI